MAVPAMTHGGGAGRIIDLLAGTAVFGTLPAHTLTRLAELALERTFRKGQFVFQQGDAGDSCYVIDSGTVKVFTTSEEGTAVVYCTLGAGDLFGELSFLDGRERSASVETLETCRMLVLRPPALDLLLEGAAPAARMLLSHQAAIIRRLTDQAGDLVVLDLPARLAKCLDRMAETAGVRTPAGIRIEIPLNQTDLAGMLGASRPSVNQALQAFARRGHLQVEGRSILILDRPALRRRWGG